MASTSFSHLFVSSVCRLVPSLKRIVQYEDMARQYLEEGIELPVPLFQARVLQPTPDRNLHIPFRNINCAWLKLKGPTHSWSWTVGGGGQLLPKHVFCGNIGMNVEWTANIDHRRLTENY